MTIPEHGHIRIPVQTAPMGGVQIVNRSAGAVTLVTPSAVILSKDSEREVRPLGLGNV